MQFLAQGPIVWEPTTVRGEEASQLEDTKIKQKVNNEEDVENLQKELEKLDEWAKANNMEFTGKKDDSESHNTILQESISAQVFTHTTSFPMVIGCV